MSAKPLAETYEELKELRRQGGLDPKIRDVIDLLKNRLVEERDTAADEEKVVRLLDILTLAYRAFGDEEKAKAWLKRPNASLSGQKPGDLLMDELGAAVVREILEQIDNGIFA
jgi:putative toxin-antitoxin system antitoxin component (TIGR02293 family)